MTIEHTESRKRYVNAICWLARGNGEPNSIQRRKGEDALHALKKDSDIWGICARVRLNHTVEKGYIHNLSEEDIDRLTQSTDPEAQLALALCYRNGYHVSADPVSAMQWISRAAEQGLAAAQLHLSRAFREGYGVHQDSEEAKKLLILAAKQELAEAQYDLGNYYYGSNDLAAAAQCFTFAAKQGLAEAQYAIGFCCSLGKGVPQDQEEAADWFALAADQEHAKAQYAIGLCLIRDERVPDNSEAAVNSVEAAAQWFTLAAEQGLAEAQNDLGCCYNEGYGVKKNKEKAVYWFTRAAKQGYEKALEECRKFLAGDLAHFEGTEVTAERLAIALQYFDPTDQLTGSNNTEKRIMDWVLDREFEASDGSNPFILLLQFRIWEIQQTSTDRTFPPPSLTCFGVFGRTEIPTNLTSDYVSGCLEDLDKIGEDFKHTGLSSEHVESLLAYIRRLAEAAEVSRTSQPEEKKEEIVRQETTHQDIGVSLEDEQLLAEQRRKHSDQDFAGLGRRNEENKENEEAMVRQRINRVIRTPSEILPLIRRSSEQESIKQKKQSEGNCRLM